MTIAILMYHHFRAFPWGNSFSLWKEHISWLKERYDIVLPGENPSTKMGICLTFDDAPLELYTHVYPLFEQWGLKGVIGVPTSYIVEESTAPCEERLLHSVDMNQPLPHFHSVSPPLCTWKELRELAQSNCFAFASHSHHHVDLTQYDGSIESELDQSKAILEQQLNLPIETFIYPFGKWNPKIHCKVIERYRYAMRIGSAFNRSWSQCNQLLFRIPAHHLKQKSDPMSWTNCMCYWAKGIIKRHCGIC